MKRVLGLFIVAICSLFIGINAKALTMDGIISKLENRSYDENSLIDSVVFSSTDSTLNFSVISEHGEFESTFNYNENEIYYTLDYDIVDENSFYHNFIDSYIALEILDVVLELNNMSTSNIDYESMTYEANGFEVVPEEIYSDENTQVTGMQSFRLNINNLNILYYEGIPTIEVGTVDENGIRLNFVADTTNTTCELYRLDEGDNIFYWIATTNCNGTYLDEDVEENKTYTYHLVNEPAVSDNVSAIYNIESGVNTDITTDTETTTETTDGLENPNTGDFMPIAILLGMLGASIILIVNLNKKNKFKKI